MNQLLESIQSDDLQDQFPSGDVSDELDITSINSGQFSSIDSNLTWSYGSETLSKHLTTISRKRDVKCRNRSNRKVGKENIQPFPSNLMNRSEAIGNSVDHTLVHKKVSLLQTKFLNKNADHKKNLKKTRKNVLSKKTLEIHQGKSTEIDLCIRQLQSMRKAYPQVYNTYLQVYRAYKSSLEQEKLNQEEQGKLIREQRELRTEKQQVKNQIQLIDAIKKQLRIEVKSCEQEIFNRMKSSEKLI